nr:MAG TPA: hypothetical protein [Caudoviricetes sp.]DAL31109.1 MAG TPA_asm: hypothetical protein [Caudoviricetes sp.]
MSKKSRFIAIRKNSNWKDTSYENFSTMKQKDKGHNRVRTNDGWRQAPKMVGGKVYGK